MPSCAEETPVMTNVESTKKRPTFSPNHFINRELSWLEFNARVLEEAQDQTNPLLERAKFLAITSSNLDEFFMVRVAGLREQTFGDEAPQDYNPEGITPSMQMKLVAQRTQAMVADQYRCWNESIQPALAAEGIEIVPHKSLHEEQRAAIDTFFEGRVFPVLTPMAIDPSHPSPLYHNRGLYLATILKRHEGLGPRKLFAVVQLPSVLPRLVEVENTEKRKVFVLLEDVIAARLPRLFGQCEVSNWTTFRITRDSDLEVLEQEADDLLRLIEERLKARRRGDAVRLEVHGRAPEELIAEIVRSEKLHDDEEYREVYRVDGPVDLTALWQLVKVPGFSHLRDPQYVPRIPQEVANASDVYAAIRQQDILLHHPFDSFDPVVEFTTRAAEDPKVLAIKQTLYRTGGDSPIVKALIEAAEQGKQVTALVELKARFDEETNVGWARQMERAGVHVVFGFLDLKTHCKVCMVIRQEGDNLRRYVHLSTGNYNPITARLYTDTGLLTDDEAIATDATALFNLLTGYSQGHRWRQLVAAPKDLHRRTLELIHEQTELAKAGKPARIFAKINSLVDFPVIEALYQASQAGVPIDLIVRGICCLRPGLPGISETIQVRSIVDQFLEHSRIFVFGADENSKIFFSSADWMPRNFHRRVEVMFPILEPRLRERILNEIIPVYQRDNVKARILQPDGTYLRAQAEEGEPRLRAQEELMRITSGHRQRKDGPAVPTKPSINV